jgi:hypothetical protein
LTTHAVLLSEREVVSWVLLPVADDLTARLMLPPFGASSWGLKAKRQDLKTVNGIQTFQV